MLYDWGVHQEKLKELTPYKILSQFEIPINKFAEKINFLVNYILNRIWSIIKLQ